MNFSRHFHHSGRTLVLAVLFFLLALSAQATVHTVVGQIESVYLNRASMKILETSVATGTPDTLAQGKRVSFNLPSTGGKKKPSIQFGNVVEVDLAGDIATEYGDAQPATGAAKIFIWTALRCDKVKNAKKYTGEVKDGGKKGKGKGKGKGKKKDEPDEPERLWTQEEAVRGTISYREKDKRVYIREEGLRPRDKGLDVVSDEWFEKLKPYNGREVVVHGTTNRSSLSSGTIEISNILRVYPK